MEEKLPSEFKKPTTKKEFEELCNIVGLRKAMEIAEIFPYDPPDLQNSDRADTRDSV